MTPSGFPQETGIQAEIIWFFGELRICNRNWKKNCRSYNCTSLVGSVRVGSWKCSEASPSHSIPSLQLLEPIVFGRGKISKQFLHVSFSVGGGGGCVGGVERPADDTFCGWRCEESVEWRNQMLWWILWPIEGFMPTSSRRSKRWGSTVVCHNCKMLF